MAKLRRRDPIMTGELPYSERLPDILAVMEQANRIASMTSLEDLLGQMLDLMIEVSGASNGTLYLLDHEAHEIIFMVVRGNEHDRRLTGKRIKENMGIVGACIQRAEPIIINDLASDPRWYREFNPDLAARLKNAITLPLLLLGKPIGSVQIFNFVRAEIELLQMLSGRMASEVDKALLLEKAKRSNQRLQDLVNAIGQIGAILDRDQLLAKITEGASTLLAAEDSTVFLIDQEGGESGSLLQKSYGTSIPAAPSSPDQPPCPPPASFLARTTVAVPLRARPIVLGKEQVRREECTIGNLMALNKRHGAFDSEDVQILEILASQASTVLQIATLYGQANELFIEFITVLAAAIDAKDPYTRGHSQRVSDISVSIAQEMGIGNDQLRDIRIGSLLHDIGKIGVPDHILGKPGKLSTEEYEVIKKHPGAGFKIIESLTLLRNVLPAVVEHHERLDGSGYPFGLHSDQISLMGRIVAVADVYDAMTTDRPYRKAMEFEAVMEYMRKNADNLFDRQCILILTERVAINNHIAREESSTLRRG
jgi:putative nucleotidyltransferase with HDIG domain